MCRKRCAHVFRLTRNSGEGGGSPTGVALSGEVEDYVLMSLGNLVWHDNGDGVTGTGVANDGKRNGFEAGIADVTVDLYRDIDGDGTADLVGSTVTDSGGQYLFTGLEPGDYTVRIPAAEFGAAGDLYQYFSTTDQTGFENPNLNLDQEQPDGNGDENGIDEDQDSDGIKGEELPAYGISSGMVSLELEQEPSLTGVFYDEDPDTNSNLTVDFGFVQYDFGDNPDGGVGGNYGTALDNNGARHVIDPDVFLGNPSTGAIDAEADGQPDAEADADDDNPAAGPDDEDGIDFVTPIMPGADFGISVTASQHGYLNGWLDLDGSGTFEDGERFIKEKELNAGTHRI